MVTPEPGVKTGCLADQEPLEDPGSKVCPVLPDWTDSTAWLDPKARPEHRVRPKEVVPAATGSTD